MKFKAEQGRRNVQAAGVAAPSPTVVPSPAERAVWGAEGPVTSLEHKPFLDGWRGLAILSVMVGHFVAFAPGRLAGTGVELFFVLSGRLMAEMLIVRRHPLPDFLFRRASRLLPALLFYVVIALLIVAAAAPAFGELDDGFIGAAAAIAFVHNYLPPEHVVSLYEHFWSLAVEEHSYLILAGITFLAVRDRRTAMAAAGLLAALAILNGWLLSAQGTHGGQYVYWRTDVRAASIFLSFAVYLWAHSYFRTARGGLWALASPASLAVGLAILLHPALPDHVRFSIGTALLAVSVTTIDVASVRFRTAFELRALTLLGLVSYSLYLWQQPFFMLSKSSLPATICVALALGCALLSYRTVEQPARRALNALWDARQRRRLILTQSPHATG